MTIYFRWGIPHFCKFFLPFFLRLIMLSGDWIPLNLPGRIKHILPDCNVVSLGGATEASIWNVIYVINNVDPSWNSIPYGKALTNQEIYVLNDNLDVRCADDPGEICIGGVGLAKGYFNNKELTRRAFVEHPVTGKRLYKTGDLGRYFPDGNIEILGRMDFQVKVNGYRIELKEIEFVLNQHPCVSDAIVNAWSKDKLSSKTLICYTKIKPNKELSPGELKAYLTGKLPPYMIPRYYYFIDEIPLSENGKINHSRLEVPAALIGKK